MDDLIITNARIVLADEVINGSVVVEGGRIAKIDSGNSSVRGVQKILMATCWCLA